MFTNIATWISSYTHSFICDVITYPCHNFNGDLAKPLKLRHGWVITSRFYVNEITYPFLSLDAVLANLLIKEALSDLHWPCDTPCSAVSRQVPKNQALKSKEGYGKLLFSAKWPIIQRSIDTDDSTLSRYSNWSQMKISPINITNFIAQKYTKLDRNFIQFFKSPVIKKLCGVFTTEYKMPSTFPRKVDIILVPFANFFLNLYFGKATAVRQDGYSIMFCNAHGPCENQ